MNIPICCRHFILFFCFFIVMVISFKPVIAQSASGMIHGRVSDENNEPIANATVTLGKSEYGTVTSSDGSFTLKDVAAGKHHVKVSSLSYVEKTLTVSVRAGQTTEVIFHLEVAAKMLDDVVVEGEYNPSQISRLPDVVGAELIGSKKNEVIDLKRMDGNIATNNTRQIFAKVPGIHIWELDGSGLQVNIAARGLNPTRSWEFIVDQNGYHINVDLYGYPEAYFTPQVHGVDHIEVIRGSAALQYGPQFGGVVNYVMKEGDTTRRFSFETQQSAGSDFMFSSYNAIGGKVGKLSYYGFFDYRHSRGFRKFSEYTLHNFYSSVKYQFTPAMSLAAQFSRMYYVSGLAGGLNDSMFQEDPYQSSRTRNFFNPNINIPALVFDWKTGENSHLSVKAWSIIGQRNSVQFIAIPTIGDTINAATNQYNPRQVDRDYYKNFSVEARFITKYILIKNNRSILSGGVKVFDSNTHRQQLGKGTTGFDFDLSVTGSYPTDLNYFTSDIAFFAENLFAITSKFSITPGARLELLQTQYKGLHAGHEYVTSGTKKVRKIPLLGVGMKYRLSDRFNLYGNFSQAYRPILYSELIPSVTIAAVDENIKDATGYNADLGIRGRIKDVLNLDISPFLLIYENKIGTLTLTTDSGTTFLYRTNVGTSVAMGIESFVEFHPLKIASKRYGSDVSLFASLAYDHATYTSGSIISVSGASGGNINLKGNKLEAAPEFIGRSGINYSYQGFSTTLQYSYVSESFADANNTVFSENGLTGIIPAYHLFDISFSYYFLERYNIRGGINNLTNEVYFTRRILAYPGPGILPADGRTFFVSIGAKL